MVSQQQYFQLFKLIEIQSTFYNLPKLETGEKWRSAAPADFEFTMKAWQLITHEPTSPTYRRLGRRIEPYEYRRYGRFQTTDEVLDAWQRTAVFARTLGATVIVFQCPASFRPTKDNVANMRAFFSAIDRDGFFFAWEPRGAWPPDVVKMLCQELDLIHCVDPFKNEPVHGAFQYFRLHGITGYAYRYTDDDLRRLHSLVGGRMSYVLFNNNWMKDDALRFIHLMQGGGE